MADSVTLSVFFRTSNPKGEEELKGIFKRYISKDLISVWRLPKKDPALFYRVMISELALSEVYSNLQEVIAHCHKNQREIYITVEYGVIYKEF